MVTATKTPRRAWVEQIMGLPISIHLRGDDVRSEATEAVVARVYRRLGWGDSGFSTYRQDSTVSALRRGEVEAEQRRHGGDVAAEQGFLVPGRAAVGPADAGQHLADVAVGAVEAEAALAEGPAQTGEAAVDGGGRPAPLRPGRNLGGEIGEGEADRLRLRAARRRAAPVEGGLVRARGHRRNRRSSAPGRRRPRR